jgi:hypothetical protein
MKIYDNIATSEHSCSCIANWQRISFDKDIQISFPAMINDTDLAEQDLLIDIVDSYGMKFRPPFTIESNRVVIKFLATEHRHYGLHNVKLWFNKGKEGQSTLDFDKAFELVRSTEEENNITFDGNDIKVEAIVNIKPEQKPVAYFDGENVVVLDNNYKFGIL